jgi:hypothetical protein
MAEVQSTAMDHSDLIAHPQEDSDMNTQQLSFNTATFLAAVVGLFLVSTTAQADWRPPWLLPALYGDDLDRCTVELRAALDTTGATSVRHTVTDIDKVGVWYVFDIETNIADGTGTVIRRAKTLCKSHRFEEHTAVEVIYQSPASNALLASTTID